MIQQHNFSYYTKIRFNLTPEENSYLLSYAGVVRVLVQAFAVKRLSHTFGCVS